MNETLVEIKALTKRFEAADKPAIDLLTTTIKVGRVTGLVGPDGAGKTTLMRLMAALLTPSSGALKVCDFDSLADPVAIHELDRLHASALRAL